MGLWDRLRGAFGGEAAPEPARPAPTEEPRPAAVVPPGRALAEVDLALVGAPGGPTEEQALEALARARGTSAEAETLALVTPAARTRGLERLCLACAEAYAQRGQAARALEVLEGASSAAALVLLADLLEEAGEPARALAAVERVLARDLTAPGAEERHARLRAKLGGRARRPAGPADATLVTPKAGRDRFRILREVARGGAGVVFEAEELPLARTIAFKLYHPAGPGGEKARRAALLEEARATVRFRGPGVVRLYDLDLEEGWISYEWVARASLRELLRSGCVDELTPLRRWALPLARALCRLHERGYVHGDLKPANVLLRAPDDPILTDLGLATEAGGRLAPGSAGYESAERLVDGAALPSEDVYAFGRVLEDAAGPTGDRSLDGLIRSWLAPRGARPRDAAALVDALSR